MRMYRMRFEEQVDATLSLQQLRGREGLRVRQAYAEASRATGVEWAGRTYRRDSWESSDPVNRALSAANSCLYGVCQAAIVSAGYSTALGFIHTGKMLSFVYDIADLYKIEVTIPVAFQAVAGSPQHLGPRIRAMCRDAFREQQLLKRIVPDIEEALAVEIVRTLPLWGDFDADAALPGALWDPLVGVVAGGVNHLVNLDDESDYGRFPA